MGKFPVFDGNDEKRQQLRIAQQLIDEYIADCIPYIEKTAYLEALEKSPHLIAIETDPSWFLTHEKWNIWSAAQRIVKYWEWKRALFGDVRAFLPISDFSGNGALNDIDMQIMRSGAVALLPKDDRGNVYVIINRSRAGEPPPWGSDFKIILRSIFFHFIFYLKIFHYDHIFDEDTGVIVINMIFTLAPNPTINLPGLINDAMPIRVLRVHNIFYRTEGNSLFMEKYVVPSFLAMNAPLFRSFTNMVFHYCSTHMEARSKLQQQGIPLECIPTFLGGSWSYDFFDDWYVHFSNENASVSQNDMQPTIRKEDNRTDTFNGSDILCTQQNNWSLDYADPSLSNQNLSIRFVRGEPEDVNAIESFNCPQEKGTTVVANSRKTEFLDGATENGQSAALKPSVPMADARNEKHQNSPSLPGLVGEVMCYDAKIASLQSKLHLNKKRIEFLKSGVFKILQLDTHGLCMLSYEPNKTVEDDFELQRCCLDDCLRLLTTRKKSMWSLIILAYLDQTLVQSKSTSNNTFVGIIESFPSINLDSIHIFFESVCLGWCSYQESAKALAIQMFGNEADKILFHVFPADEDETGNEAEVARSQIMAGMALTADLRALDQSLDDFKERELLSKYALEATPFSYPLACFTDNGSL